MACRGCAQSGDCACAVVGDGSVITVSGTGGALDPYEINFNGINWVDSLSVGTPDLCTESVTVVARRADGTVERIAAPSRCAVIL